MLRRGKKDPKNKLYSTSRTNTKLSLLHLCALRQYLETTDFLVLLVSPTITFCETLGIQKYTLSSYIFIDTHSVSFEKCKEATNFVHMFSL
jgi:hypothetical protein